MEKWSVNMRKDVRNLWRKPVQPSKKRKVDSHLGKLKSGPKVSRGWADFGPLCAVRVQGICLGGGLR